MSDIINTVFPGSQAFGIGLPKNVIPQSPGPGINASGEVNEQFGNALPKNQEINLAGPNSSGLAPYWPPTVGVGKDIPIAGSSNAGAMPAAMADQGLPTITALTDADATVQPAAPNTSGYTIGAASQTANRTTTLGTAGPPQTGQMVSVTRHDLSNNQRAIVNGGPLAGTLYTFPASPTTSWIAWFQYNNADWQFVGVQPLAVS